MDSRRSVLKSIGAASTLSLTGVVSADELEVKVLTELREPGDGLSQDEAITTQQREFASFADSDQLVVGSAQPKSDDAEIVGLAAAVNRDGETRQFVGVARDDQRVSEIHDDVRVYAQQFAEELSTRRVQTNISVEEPWQLFDDSVYEDLSASGDIVSDGKVYNWTGSRTDYDRWGVLNTFNLTPSDGLDLGNHIQNCQMHHDWSNYGGTGLAIVSRQPASSNDNAQTGVDLSLSSAGASIGFTYTQQKDVARTVTQDPYVTNYDWQFTDFDWGEDTSQFSTGTEVAADQNSIGLSDPLLKLDGRGDFSDDGDEYVHEFGQFFEVI